MNEQNKNNVTGITREWFFPMLIMELLLLALYYLVWILGYGDIFPQNIVVLISATGAGMGSTWVVLKRKDDNEKKIPTVYTPFILLSIVELFIVGLCVFRIISLWILGSSIVMSTCYLILLIKSRNSTMTKK